MKLIDKLMAATPKANWICEESGLAWLKLNIHVPHREIFEEWQKVSHLAVSHRSDDVRASMTNKGWKSLTLYGVAHDITDSTPGDKSWTEISNRCPITTKWAQDNFIIDNSTGRIRFMLLEPGGFIMPHKDRSTRRLSEINVAVHQPTDCWFKFLNNGFIPFQSGEAYMIDTSNEHMVVNQSQEERLHIILHTKVEDKLLEESYASSYHRR